MGRGNKKSVIAKRIAITFFVLAVLAMILSYGIGQSTLIQIEMDDFASELRSDTKKNVVAAKNLLDGMVGGLAHTAAAIQDYDDLWDPEVQRVLELSQQMNDFDAVFIADTNGNAYADTGYEFSVQEQKFFSNAMQENVVFSEVMPSKRYKAIQIISFPMYTEEQELRGILFGLFDVETFSRLINNVVDYKESIYVIDSNGTYINCFDANHEMPGRTNFWQDLESFDFKDTTINEIKKDFLEQKEGEISYSDQGVQRYGYHMPLGIQNWQIVLTVEETAVSSHIEMIRIIDTSEVMVNLVLLAVMLLCAYTYFKSVNNEMQETNQKISKNNEMMRMAVELSDHIIFEYDIQKKRIELKTEIKNVLFSNQIIEPVPECLIDKNIVSADSVTALKDMFEKIKEEKSSQADIQIIARGKERVWYRVAIHNVYDEQGRTVGTVGSAEDISMLKKGEEAIKRKDETRRLLINNAVMYARIDLNTDTVLELNGQEVYKSYENYLYKHIVERVSEEHQSYVAKKLSIKSLKDDYDQEKEGVEIQCIMKKAQEAKWVSCSIYRTQADDPSQVAIVILDIDKKKREEIALKEKAERDGLTGLYNAATTRAKISEVLCSKHSSQESQIFILLDLDNFKQINDTFGHACGDQVLMDIADVLNKRFRSSDIIGRLGGDEFVVFLCNVKSNDLIETLMEGFSDALTKTYTQGDVSLTVSASMGVAVSPRDGMTLEEIYKKADIALYQSKNQKKLQKINHNEAVRGRRNDNESGR